MWTLLKQLWTDPAYFRACIKAAISSLGGLILVGVIPTANWKYGWIPMALAHLIPTGDTTSAKSATIVAAATVARSGAVATTAEAVVAQADEAARTSEGGK